MTTSFFPEAKLRLSFINSKRYYYAEQFSIEMIGIREMFQRKGRIYLMTINSEFD